MDMKFQVIEYHHPKLEVRNTIQNTSIVCCLLIDELANTSEYHLSLSLKNGFSCDSNIV